MNYVSAITKDSAACPGVRFTIRDISEGQRRRLRRELAPAFARISDIEVEREEFYERIAARVGKPAAEIKLDELTPRERADHASILARIDLVNDCDVTPAYFRAGFVSVDGLIVDGKATFTADELAEMGPPPLVREITRAITRGAQLDESEKANLSLPSTSPAAVEGATSDISAGPASGPGGSATGTVGASPAA